MAKKYPSELNTKTVRIGIGAWALLTDIIRRAGVTIAEALDLALNRQEPEPEPMAEPAAEPAASKSPRQIPLIPVFFKPKTISGNRAFFKPKTISGNGATHIKIKSIS